MPACASTLGDPGKSKLVVLFDLYGGNAAFRFLLNFSLLGWLTLVCLDVSGGLAPGAPMIPSLPLTVAAATAPATPAAAPAVPAPQSSAPPAPQSASAPPTASLAQALDAAHAASPASPRFADLGGPAFADAPAALRPALADVASGEPGRVASGLVLLSRAAGEGTPFAMTAYGLARLAPPAAQPADTAQGRQWLQRGADAGQPKAASLLARAYLTGGAGFVDRAKAEDLLRRAFQLGDAASGLQLAALRAADGGAAATAEAEHLLRITAEQGDLSAQRTLGRYLMAAADGRGVGLDEAAVWLTRAAGRGDADAMEALGDLHLYVAKAAPLQDPAKGVAWYRRCADKGRAACRYALGRSYRLGLGVAPDRAQAWALLTLARDGGAPKASAELKSAEEAMTPADRADGLRLLQDLSTAK